MCNDVTRRLGLGACARHRTEIIEINWVGLIGLILIIGGLIYVAVS